MEERLVFGIATFDEGRNGLTETDGLPLSKKEVETVCQILIGGFSTSFFG